MKRTRDHALLSDVASLLVCGLVAGLVIAAAVFPAVAIAGLGAKAGAESFEHLPSELKTEPLALRTSVKAADGSPVTTFWGEENRIHVGLASVPAIVQQATIAAEDARFYQHHGVDTKGVVRALVANAQGQTQGASTLTQQYVRLVLFSQAKTEEERAAAIAQTPARKIQEMRYAIALEKKLDKKEILERYLNIAFYGNNAYGIGAAAQAYFSKAVPELTPVQAATLAGLVKSPSTYAGNEKAMFDRRNYVLQRMNDLGFLSGSEAKTAKAAPLGLRKRDTPRRCLPNEGLPGGGITADNGWGFYCDWFRNWWEEQPAFGRTVEERRNLLETGGFRVKLALDPKVQKVAQKQVEGVHNRGSKWGTGVVLLDPKTGRVKAMAINRTFSQRPNPGGKAYPNTVFPYLTGSAQTPERVGYHAGSTFKVFAAVAALKKGIPLAQTINTTGRYVSQKREQAGSPSSCPGPGGLWYYCPKNYDVGSRPISGTFNMWSGFSASINTFFIPLTERAGLANVIDTASQMGIRFFPGRATEAAPQGQNTPEFLKQNDILSFPLGQGAEVYPLYVASAYGTLANRGVHCTPSPVLEIRDSAGKVVMSGKPTCKRVLEQGVADAAADMARCPVGDQAKGGSCAGPGGPTAGSVGATINRPVAGKTGSTPDNTAVWFAGFTPNLAGASFITNMESPSTPNPNGGDARAINMVFARTLNAGLAGLPEEDFHAPPAQLARGVPATVPNVAGMSVSSAQDRLRQAGFQPIVASARVNSGYSAGAVARTDPWGGASSSRGSVVTLYISNGIPAPPPTPTQSGGGTGTGGQSTPPPVVTPGAGGARPPGRGPGRGWPQN
ncbi:MAG TPA: transglycosylase domain-containing protein [Mycobacteriales bacterium]|nr:transglycosylase domain-containing protein [Mycobacteriales bacterium]